MNQLSEHVCEVCARLFKGGRKRHYCPHCKKYFAVCHECQTHNLVCPKCGIRLQKKLEPIKKLTRV